MTETIRTALIDLIHAEALCLDQQRWQDWLDLYLPDCVFWIPAWKDEHLPTDDPETEVSLVYAAGRDRLQERVRRATGSKSMASQPLPRTLHCVANALPRPGADAGSWLVHSNCVTHIYDLRTEAMRLLACRCEHTVVEQGGALRIARKKAFLINDKVPTVLDFYSV